jgi:hypothetical protein
MKNSNDDSAGRRKRLRAPLATIRGSNSLGRAAPESRAAAPAGPLGGGISKINKSEADKEYTKLEATSLIKNGSGEQREKETKAKLESQSAGTDKKNTAKKKWNTILDVLRDTIFANSLYLSDPERDVLLFIFRRTRMYGKEWEKIPLRHFTEGVWSRKNGDVCSRLVMKANTVIEARDHLRAKGIIQVREHSVRAYEYRVCEPGEVAQHDIVTYLIGHQPKQLAALLRELRRNRKRLPPTFLQVLELAEHELNRPGRASSQDTPRDTTPVPREAKQTLPHGIEPTNKPNLRIKRPTPNIAPSTGARPGNGFVQKISKKKLRVFPKSQFGSDKSDAIREALNEAANWKNEKRLQRIARPSVKTWQRVWSETMKTFYPAVVVDFPDSAFRNLKSAADKWRVPAEDMAQLISWTIENWQYLRRHVFSYNRTTPYGPDSPEVGFFIIKLSRIHLEFDTRVTWPAMQQRTAQSPTQWQPPSQPARSAAPPRYPNLQIDHKRAKEIQKKLGFKNWDEP